MVTKAAGSMKNPPTNLTDTPVKSAAEKSIANVPVRL